MRIAIDGRGANWYSGTGIGTYTQEIINNLLEYDTQNYYNLYWCGTNYTNFNRKNTTISIGSKKHHKFFEESFIPVNLKNKAIDIYHVPQNGIGLPMKKCCVSISTIHDLIPYVMPETVGKGYLKRFIAQMPQIIQNSDMIVTVSEYSKGDIMRIFDVPEDRIAVTHLAADDIFSPMNKAIARSLLEKTYGINKDFILYLGGFSPRKNVKGILLAFSRIYKNLSKDYKVVIIGPSRDEHQYLTELCQSMGIEEFVCFPGYVPREHLPYFYNSCSVFVYPSLYEGFGLPPLEAMSCKAPVITSKVSSIPEVVKDGALLINPFDIEEFKTTLENVLENTELRVKLSEAGYARSKDFSWRKTALETLKVYESAYKIFK